MKKLKSIAVLSAFVVTMALSFSSCGTNKAAIAQLNELDQKIAAIEAETETVKKECENLKGVIFNDQKQIDRLRSNR